MNNDLIRRQSVIELIDDLMKSPYANSPQFGSERRECMDLVKELCEHRLPAAYDVDKVVERLEDMKYVMVGNYGVRREVVNFDDLIESVKSGCIE